MPTAKMVMFRDNWLKFGFGDDLGPQASNAPFVIDYSGACPHPTLDGASIMEIAHDACRHIHKTRQGPLTLMVSGGVDSQAMAYAFKTSGVPCRYISARYNGGLNDHDIFSTTFYEDNDIPIDVIDIDLRYFHEVEMKGWANTYQNYSPHLLAHCKIASMVKEGTVISSGAIVTRQNLSETSYSVFGLERYARISRQSVIGFFFSYCPHLVYATRDLLVDQLDDLYSAKVEVYLRAGFPVIAQETKFHGFEKIKELYDDVEIDAKIRRRYSNRRSSRPYDLLFRYPLADAVKYSDRSKAVF